MAFAKMGAAGRALPTAKEKRAVTVNGHRSSSCQNVMET